MFQHTRDLRVESFRPLIPPAILLEELPLSNQGSETVARGRQAVSRIVNGRDDRLVAVVGPCSIHDPLAALDYGRRLRALAEELAGDLCVVMRVYFEKPRTTVGWKGLINDPRLDGSFAINEGLRLARRLLLELAELGLPAGCEFLDPISPQFTSDLVTWGAIGARTTESQVHRELASGLSMPVGFKNGTDGGVQIAIDAVRSAAHPHSFLGVTEQGLGAIVSTRGNGDCHVILRGGQSGPNHDALSVQKTAAALRDAGARYVIVGHSERRQLYAESDPIVNRKVRAALASRLTVIMCVGETLDQREQGIAEDVVSGQLSGGLSGLTASDLDRIIVAYEPVWAIGTGRTATPEQAQEMHAFIRRVFAERHSKAAGDALRILYGGSVKPDNIAGLMKQADIDGALVKKCKAAAAEAGVAAKVEFGEGNVLEVEDLSDASVVLLYMGEDINNLLKPVLKRTLKAGARVVSHRFEMEDWRPDRKKHIKSTSMEFPGYECDVLLWIIKASDKK